jgi:hypothetical protein
MQSLGTNNNPNELLLKLTKSDKDIIKSCANRLVPKGTPRVLVIPSIRKNPHTQGTSVNMLLLGGPNLTEFYDKEDLAYLLKRGIPVTSEFEAIVEFLVYSAQHDPDDRELEDHMIVYFDRKGVRSVKQTHALGLGLWSREFPR